MVPPTAGAVMVPTKKLGVVCTPMELPDRAPSRVPALTLMDPVHVRKLLVAFAAVQLKVPKATVDAVLLVGVGLFVVVLVLVGVSVRV